MFPWKALTGIVVEAGGHGFCQDEALLATIISPGLSIVWARGKGQMAI